MDSEMVRGMTAAQIKAMEEEDLADFINELSLEEQAVVEKMLGLDEMGKGDIADLLDEATAERLSREARRPEGEGNQPSL